MHDLDRAGQPVEPLLLAGPHEALQQACPLIGRDVDRREVDADASAHTRLELEQPAWNGLALLAREAERRVLGPPLPGFVLVPVPVPHEVEPGARAELHDVELVSTE